MPLPVAHSLAGGAIYASGDADGGLFTWKRLLLALFIANAPDLDFLPGLLMGEPNRFHHGPTHSLGMVVIVAALAAGVAALGARWPVRGRIEARAVAGTALMVGALWLSHVLLDAFTEDLLGPFGVPLLWPLSDRYFLFYPWFPHVARYSGSSEPIEFFVSLLNTHNVWAATVEILTLGPPLALLIWWRRRRRPDVQEPASPPSSLASVPE
jgi:inner membrane protein